MAVITIPAEVLASVGGLSYGQVRYDMEERSEATGASATRLLGPPRWQFGLSSKQAMSLAQAGEWEAMLLRLRGSVNHLAVYDLLRPAPLGSMRGTTRLIASRAIGDTTIGIRGIRRDTQLLEEGITLDGAMWTSVNGGTVIANSQPGPGSAVNTADSVVDNSSSLGAGISQAITVPNDGATYTVSIYARVTGGTPPTPSLEASLTGGTAVNGIFRWNSTSGAVLSGGATVVLDADPTWWRVSGSVTNNSSGNTTLTVSIYPARCAHNSAVADGTQTASYPFWGVKLEVGSSATAYQRTITLEPGDWLQVGTPGVGTSQLVKVVTFETTSTSDVLSSVQFEPPLRYAFAADAPVAWDKPLAYCKLTNSAQTWAARPNGPAIDGFGLDLLEDWGA